MAPAPHTQREPGHIRMIPPLFALTLVVGCSPPAGDDSADTGGFVVPDPPAAPGFQLHAGPIDVPVGEEAQLCYYMDAPVDAAIDGGVDVIELEFAYTEGSHHVNVFRTEDPTYMQPDGTVVTDCWDALDFDKVSLVANSQLESLHWVLPETTYIPVTAASQFIVQVHYVNVEAGEQTTPSGEGEVYINFHAQEHGARPDMLGALFANNRSISLPPHEYSSFTAACMLPEGTNLVALSGHFHSRGTQFLINRFTAETEDSPAVVGDELYASTAWDEPPFATYDAAELVLGADQGLAYTCDFFNDTDETIVFGAHVETDEHCNMFGYYFPAAETSTYCF